MLSFASTAGRIASTTRKLEKTALVAEYLKSLAIEDAARVALFLSGRAFPAHEETTLGAGGSLLWQAVAAHSGMTEAELHTLYRSHGDLGAVAEAASPDRPATLKPSDVEASWRPGASAVE